MLTPERDLAPFCPRPAVLPLPEPMPRPTRMRPLRAPWLSRISLSFMSCTRFRFCRACPRWGQVNGLSRFLDLHEVLHLLDLAEDLGRLVKLHATVKLVETEPDERRAL